MNKGIYTTSYMITMGLVLIYFVTEPTYRRCSFPYSFVVGFQGGFVSVVDEPAYFQTHDSYDGFEGVVLRAFPRVSRGPMDHRFTFYSRVEFMSDRSMVMISDLGEHSEEQLDLAFEAVVESIKDHPDYSYLRPGQPAHTQVDPNALAACGGGLAGVAVVPGLVAWLLGCVARTKQESSYTYRRDHKMCVGCGYSTLGLDTGVCPECGGEHGCTIVEVV